MTAATQTEVITQVHRVYIKATPEAVWDADTVIGCDSRHRRQGVAMCLARAGNLFASCPQPIPGGLEGS